MHGQGIRLHSCAQYLGYHKKNSHWMSVVCGFIDYMDKLKYQHNAKTLYRLLHYLFHDYERNFELCITTFYILYIALKVKLVRIRFHQNSAGCKSWWKQSKFWKFFCPNSSPIIETKSEIIPQYTMWTVNDVLGKNYLENHSDQGVYCNLFELMSQ